MARRFALPSLASIFGDAIATARRFPLPVAAAVAFTVIFNVRGGSLFSAFGGDAVGRIETFLVLAFFWSLAAKLAAESRRWTLPSHLALLLPGLGLLALPVFGFARSWGLTSDSAFFFLCPGLVLLVMAAPFLTREADNAAFWEFNRAAWLAVAFAFLAALLVGFGLMALDFALEELFGYRPSSHLGDYIWVFAWALLWPWLALSGIPHGFAAPDELPPPKWAAFLASYIAVPLVVLYLVILYAYIAKVLIAWELPRGQVGYLVSGFAIAGVIAHLVGDPLRETGKAWVRAFQRHFYRLLWPPLILLWVAVGVRVADYGVTESRYLVALFALWLTGLALYFSLRGRRLIAVPLCLALLLLAAGTGPWGAAAVSTHSQVNALTALLQRHDLLRDGRIRKAEDEVPFTDRQRISSIVEYLVTSDKRDALAPLIADLTVDPGASPESHAILGAMGLAFATEWEEQDSFNYWASEPSIAPVAGYDFLLSNLSTWSDPRPYPVPGRDRQLRIGWKEKGRLLAVGDTTGQEVVFDLARLVQELRPQAALLQSGDQRAPGLLTLEASDGALRVRLRIQSISGLFGGAGAEVRNANFSLLIAWDE